MKLRRANEVTMKMDMTPMIDCVFLLLVFFMVGSTLHKQEADISFSLPGTADQSEPVQIPDEQIIEIYADGTVVLNDLKFDSPTSSSLPELIETLKRFKATAEANKTESMITIAPAPEVKHQRVVDVLNACAEAKIQNVSFAMEGDS
ncbi:MAG TPA: biopolymer transporter ExbD [Kiritimatiellia bacterium]|nr:biopolymer transporter ExbD [Kiritimatiellia bacterium]HMP34739.1 biopolymer transporter ExbD [Kiritimatiellia bacterium]